MENLTKDAKADLMARARVCRHTHGGTAVLADQFDEQTYIKRGKGAGGMKGIISTSPEQVTVWVNSFSVCALLEFAMEDIYSKTGDKKNPCGEKDR